MGICNHKYQQATINTFDEAVRFKKEAKAHQEGLTSTTTTHGLRYVQ